MKRWNAVCLYSILLWLYIFTSAKYHFFIFYFLYFHIIIFICNNNNIVFISKAPKKPQKKFFIHRSASGRHCWASFLHSNYDIFFKQYFLIILSCRWYELMCEWTMVNILLHVLFYLSKNLIQVIPHGWKDVNFAYLYTLMYARTRTWLI